MTMIKPTLRSQFLKVLLRRVELGLIHLENRSPGHLVQISIGSKPRRLVGIVQELEDRWVLLEGRLGMVDLALIVKLVMRYPDSGLLVHR